MPRKPSFLDLFSNLPGKAPHLVRGNLEENRACRFLEDHGLTLTAKNFRCRQGELDLIMHDGRTLVIVEVRYRQSARHGSALESITRRKQSRIIAAAQIYLSRQKLDCPLRFDVVAVSGDGSIHWIPNAFSA